VQLEEEPQLEEPTLRLFLELRGSTAEPTPAEPTPVEPTPVPKPVGPTPVVAPAAELRGGPAWRAAWFTLNTGAGAGAGAVSWERFCGAEEARWTAALAVALGAGRHETGGNVMEALQRALPSASLEHVRCVPWVGDVARRLPPEVCHSCVSARALPSGRRSGRPVAGLVLASARQTVEAKLAAGAGLLFFKIGITANPLQRWYYYEEELYEQLYLLACFEETSGAQMLEAALISHFRETSGCRNEAPGGEGLTGKPPFFTYLVVGRADR
jgi:hypothetical protein